MFSSDQRPTIRQLPLPAKMVVTVFLISVGCGYFTAMVQLHYQHAKPGSMMPTFADARDIFHGIEPGTGSEEEQMSKIETLVTADENLQFSGSGQMVDAFLDRSVDWEDGLEAHGGDEGAVRAERLGERDALVAWINSGPERERFYGADNFPLPASLADAPITPYVLNEDGGVMIHTLIEGRCTVCHTLGQNGPDFDTYADLVPYMEQPEKRADGMVAGPRRISVEKLAQSTHAHWLSFAMLYGLTGLIFACTSYPFWLRVTLAPLVLVVQMIDMACWWLARLDGVGVYFAQAIIVTGGVVGLGLGTQILLSLFNLYGNKGRAVLVGLMLLAGCGAAALTPTILDELEKEQPTTGEGGEAETG